MLPPLVQAETQKYGFRDDDGNPTVGDTMGTRRVTVGTNIHASRRAVGIYVSIVSYRSSMRERERTDCGGTRRTKDGCHNKNFENRQAYTCDGHPSCSSVHGIDAEHEHDLT